MVPRIMGMWISQTKGEVHHDRRLHQLMLFEASKEWALRLKKGSTAISSVSSSIKVEEREPADCRTSIDSNTRVASSPTDSVSSLHDALNLDFRSAITSRTALSYSDALPCDPIFKE
jgi:hypothetical protein